MHKQHLLFFLAPTIPVIPINKAKQPVTSKATVEKVTGLNVSKSKCPPIFTNLTIPKIIPAKPTPMVTKVNNDNILFKKV